MRILFMGTPDFAAKSLEALTDAGMEVAAVVSQPDKPKGRGHKLQPTEVKIAAEKAGIPVFQPEKLKNGELNEVLDKIQPELIVVAAYGKILPEYIINYPKYGCINVHASLLPKYRGAAPIQWAIINGEKETGVTIMQMDKGLDTGDMLMSEKTEIGKYETAGELFDRLAKMGGKLLVRAIAAIECGGVIPVPQNHDEHTYAPMISKETGKINWKKSAEEISKLVCGMNPWPAANTLYKGEALKIYGASVAQRDGILGEAGKILGTDKGCGLKVAAGRGALYIKSVQFPGSKRMDVEDYMRGHSIEYGIVLGR